MLFVYIGLGAATLLVIISILIANGLVYKKNQVRNAEAGIDALSKKRFDLVPNLVAAVKNYMKHERDTLTAVTEMRTKAMAPGLSQGDRARLDAALGQKLGSILVAVEQYPDLKANVNFLQLQAALNETEEQISAARRAYNAAVTDYNNALEMFPSSLFAGILRYQPKELFTAGAEEKTGVNVDRMFNS
jgi:LemA protein